MPITTVDEDLVRYTTFTNVDGAMSAGIGTFFNKQIKRETYELRFRGGVNTSYNKNIGFINGEKYQANRYGINPNIRFSYVIDEVLDINPNYSLNYTTSSYDISSNRDEEATNHRIGLETTTYWPKNLIFGNDISYNRFGNVSPGFDNTSILWNLSLGYQFLDENATVKVNVYDLLDQNVDTRRIIGDDFIQDTRSLILTRYAMLSFTYKLNNLGGNQNDRGGRRR
ncbi:outer membrane beta-barrel family protein [Antarcticibacterium sp. 1MA-6-2]|uniref:outer membrane beta-barrel protein n=1 Tax=Antarcticibacterium sp. 1MA-6-2 TaxID=2908210 RepID=UPI001F39F241|nr:outer membrane beta-barrel protein [Antarcticibacterium sp. 1MA-6-2]UJH90757.1 outer membrane beta-barrel family protein [Antarcticibacterium sp. 1MA-6-2]